MLSTSITSRTRENRGPVCGDDKGGGWEMKGMCERRRDVINFEAAALFCWLELTELYGLLPGPLEG